jgi:hypothetical protein
MPLAVLSNHNFMKPPKIMFLHSQYILAKKLFRTTNLTQDAWLLISIFCPDYELNIAVLTMSKF